MLVSVVIPCYGEGRFLDACLKSVRSQTHTDLDIVVIDDGGLGDSLGQALPHALADNRIRLFQLAPNCGLGACRNAALKLTLADWVVFLDGDDLLTPNAISAHVARVMELQATEADLSNFVGVYGDWSHIVETGTLNTKVRPTRKGLGRVTWASCQAINPFIVSSPLVRKDALLRVKGFAEHTTAGEDFIAWMKLLRSGGWFEYTTETVTLYRQKAGSMLRNSALELLAVWAEVQKLYFDDFKDGVPLEDLNRASKPQRGLRHSGKSTVDVRDRPKFETPEKGNKADRQFELRREIVLREFRNDLPEKVREVFELRSSEAGVWAVSDSANENTSEVPFLPDMLTVVESRAELIEATLSAKTIHNPVDILLPESLLSSITDLDFSDLNEVRFLILGQARIRYSQYQRLLLYRDWGTAFDTVFDGFKRKLPSHTVLKSCGISALNWKPLGAAKRYRLPHSNKFVQGAADEITLFSRGVSVVGSPIVEAFARPPSTITRKELLVLAPHGPSLPADQGAKLGVWVETITALLDNASVPYRLASLDSEVAKDLMLFGCVTVGYRDLFAYPKVISTFSDELFFMIAAGTPVFMYELNDQLGGTEFLRSTGLPVCDDVRELPEALTEFVHGDAEELLSTVTCDHLAKTPVSRQVLSEALGVDKAHQSH